MVGLDTDITQISRVGLATAKKLKRLGVETVRDLLFYFPYRYDDFSKITPINELKAGTIANTVGQIELIQNKRSPRKRMYITEALVSDGEESLRVVWFNQPFIAKTLRVGDTVSLSGKIDEDYGGEIMKSPAYEKLLRSQAIHTQGLVPNYHLTADITQKQVRFLTKQIVGLADVIADFLPEETRKNVGLIRLGEAVRKAHFPNNQKDILVAKKRLGFDELFLVQLRSQLSKIYLKDSLAEKISFHEKETKNLVYSLPFKLTEDQRKASWEIIKDMEKESPMTRLLEGDVGSGKTVVALIAMFNVALNKKQAALMVPTEILARQHFDSICKMLDGWKIKVGLITRSNKEIWNHDTQGKNRKEKVFDILSNADIIIGTHALIQEDIDFRDLSLVVIDEQHRFGVKQRSALAKRKSSFKPHLLSMTATPIPRSLAMAIYGDLNISIINEMPKNRKQIATQVVSEEKRERAYQFIRDEIKKGRQAFVVCPLIDFSDKLGVKSVKEEFEKLKKHVFSDLKVEMLHGKMKTKEKEGIMQRFLDNKINILVSTSVVEVGVDVPNASVMMIEGSDRFGLAQLHQFRGRVGRSDYQSYCFLFTESDSSSVLNRLSALVNNHDGFSLANMDLKFRGPGEVYGTLQKGFPELKIASLFDYELMKTAKDQAEKIIKKDPSLKSYPGLREKIGEWEKRTHLE